MYKQCCEYYKKNYSNFQYCPICGTHIRSSIYKLKDPNNPNKKSKYILIKQTTGVDKKHETKICLTSRTNGRV